MTQRSMEGRRLRRHVLRGAVIVFVTAGYSGKRFIYEKVGCALSLPAAVAPWLRPARCPPAAELTEACIAHRQRS